MPFDNKIKLTVCAIKQTTPEEEPDNSFRKVWQNGYCGFKHSNGQMICRFIYDEALNFKEGLAAVSLNGKWGYYLFGNVESLSFIPFKFSIKSSWIDS